VYKKRWYDGLNDIYEGKDEFEIKFGCFGGDGGGESSGPTAQDQNRSMTPEERYADNKARAINGPSSTGTPSGNQTAGMTSDQAQANKNISNNIAAAISANQAINNPANQAISDQFSALASAPTSSVSQNVSAVSNAPSVTGLSGFNTGLSNYSGLNTGVPTGLNTGTPTSAQDVMAQATDINNNPLGVNIGGFNVAPGMVGNAPGLIGTIDFAKGGAVNQGIGSVFPYPRRR